MFNEQRPVQILELFGGIGSPRCALRNLGIPTKAIDYVEIDEKAVRSYNSMFAEELPYKTQSVVGWNLKPDILIHGSPCQDMSIAGHQGKAKAEDGRVNRGKGADQGSGTRSSLMWETIHIIEQMGKWKPKYVIWENVRNVTSRHMIANFIRYQKEMERMGYTNNYEVLDAREFGLPQARERVFTISVLGGEKFQFDELIRTPMRSIDEFLEKNEEVPEVYDVTQPWSDRHQSADDVVRDRTSRRTGTSEENLRQSIEAIHTGHDLHIPPARSAGHKQQQSGRGQEVPEQARVLRPLDKAVCHRRKGRFRKGRKENVFKTGSCRSG